MLNSHFNAFHLDINFCSNNRTEKKIGAKAEEYRKKSWMFVYVKVDMQVERIRKNAF